MFGSLASTRGRHPAGGAAPLALQAHEVLALFDGHPGSARLERANVPHVLIFGLARAVSPSITRLVTMSTISSGERSPSGRYQ